MVQGGYPLHGFDGFSPIHRHTFQAQCRQPYPVHDERTHRHDNLNKKSCVDLGSILERCSRVMPVMGHVNHPKFGNHLGARTKLNPWGFRKKNGNLMQWQ
jgi:hypothetical protein